MTVRPIGVQPYSTGFFHRVLNGISTVMKVGTVAAAAFACYIQSQAMGFMALGLFLFAVWIKPRPPSEKTNAVHQSEREVHSVSQNGSLNLGNASQQPPLFSPRPERSPAATTSYTSPASLKVEAPLSSISSTTTPESSEGVPTPMRIRPRIHNQRRPGGYYAPKRVRTP